MDANEVQPGKTVLPRSVAVALVLGTASAAVWSASTLHGQRGMPAAAAEPPSSSTSSPQAPGPDQRFLTAVHQIGINPAADPTALIEDGHQVCQLLGNGASFDQVVADVQAGFWVNPSQANIDKSRKFAMAAVDVYCPQYQTSENLPAVVPPSPK